MRLFLCYRIRTNFLSHAFFLHLLLLRFFFTIYYIRKNIYPCLKVFPKDSVKDKMTDSSFNTFVEESFKEEAQIKANNNIKTQVKPLIQYGKIKAQVRPLMQYGKNVPEKSPRRRDRGNGGVRERVQGANKYSLQVQSGIYIVHFDNSPPPLLKFIFFPDKFFEFIVLK